MSAQYAYLVADLVSGDILDELTLTNVSFSRALNDVGSLRGELVVANPPIGMRNLHRHTEPGHTVVYVDRDGMLVWGGIIWTARYSVTDQKLEIGASDFLSYFEHRRILSVPPGSPVTYDDDQLTIARQLVELAQSHPGGDLGIEVVGPEQSGVQRQMSYGPSALKLVAEALRELASAQDGFDFAFDVAYGPDGRPQRRLVLGYPRLGQPGTPHVWEYGANLVTFSWPGDGSAIANRVFAQGAGSEEDQLIETAQDTGAFVAGWPLLEDAVSYLDIEDRAVLTKLAQAELAARRYPVVLPELTVRADREPMLGSYDVGDDARIIVDDLFFGDPLDVTVRILGFEVTPGDNPGQEEVTLTVAPIPEPL